MSTVIFNFFRRGSLKGDNHPPFAQGYCVGRRIAPTTRIGERAPTRVLAIAPSQSRTFASVFNDSILSLLFPGFAGRSSQKSFRPRKNLTTNGHESRSRGTNPRETEDHGDRHHRCRLQPNPQYPCNRADGISEIKGKAARAAASELGSERVSTPRFSPYSC